MGLSIFKIESVFDKGGNKRNPNINTLNKTRNDDIQDTNGTVCNNEHNERNVMVYFQPGE